jgi:hypothetical protein
MSEPLYSYDEMSDTLSIAFTLGEHATGIELTDHILLRLNTRDRRAVGIILLDYSLLTQTTDVGQKSYPLTGFDDLTEETRALVIDILRQSPVNEILVLSAYTPAVNQTIPIIAIHPMSITPSS